MAAPLPMIAFVPQPDPAEFLEVLRGFQMCLKAANGFGGFVRRAIIHHDHVDALQTRGFVEHRQPFQAGFDQVLLIVGRHNDGKRGAGAVLARWPAARGGRVSGQTSRARISGSFCRWRRAHRNIVSSRKIASSELPDHFRATPWLPVFFSLCVAWSKASATN